MLERVCDITNLWFLLANASHLLLCFSIPLTMSVQNYYAELQKGMIRAGVHDETEDKICHFYGGLQTEIQDIVDYKEYNTVNHLFQLAMLAEKELQG
jgi:hypothetical protein